MQYVWTHNSGMRTTLIIDPKTGNLLQQVTTPLRALAGTPPADFYQRTVYLQRAIVASIASLPGGGTQPYDGASPLFPVTLRRIHPHATRPPGASSER